VSIKGVLARAAWTHSQSLAGKIVRFSDVEVSPPEARKDKAFFKTAGIKGLISLPLSLSGRIVGVLVLTSHHAEARWPKETVHQLTLLASVFAGMIERRHRQSELQERLKHETLIAELGARFINLSADDDVDGAIEAAQRHFCKTLGLDHSSLFQPVDPEQDTLLLTHFFQSEDQPLPDVVLEKRPDQRLPSNVYWVRRESEPAASYRRFDVKEFFPWVYQRLRKGKRVIFSRRKELPKEAAFDREMFRRYGTRSAVVVPLSAGGAWLGCVSFAMVRQIRIWSEQELRCLESFAQTFASALARKRVNETLRESEERLSLATESAGAGLWSLRIQTGQVWASPRLRELLQFAPDEELTRESFSRKVHPEDRDQVRQAVENAIKTGEDGGLEFRIVLVDGSVRWLSARGRREGRVAGKAELFMGALIDVTDRKRADEALRQSEERLRLVLEANSEGVWDWDIGNQRAFFSPRYTAMLGYECEEFSQDYASWEALVHLDDLERVNQALRAHVYEGKEYGVEFRMRKKSGEWCWILSRGTVVERSPDGRALRMVGTHLDITARKQAEERAQESEQRFLLMANSAPVFIWASGQDGLRTFVNQPWLEFTGRTSEQELGTGWAEGLHPDDREGCLKVYKEAFDARRSFSMEYRMRRYDGLYRWLMDHGVPRYDSQHNFAGYIGSCVDVSERKHAEADAQRSRHELAHMGRVSILGELAGSLAHELNQPLTAILSNAQAAQRILSAARAKRKEMRAILEDIVEADHRAADVIVRMRAMLKKGDAKMLPLDLNLLARGVLGLIHSELVVRNVAITSHFAKGLPLVRGDRVQLQQVLLNLIMNACEALHANRESTHKLTIETQRFDRDQVKVAISDTGPGFPAEMLERPFEPFRTTKANGLGLGLAICRSIINAHGGQLWVANNDSGGAMVCFALPTNGKEPA